MSIGERFPVTRPEVEQMKQQINDLLERVSQLEADQKVYGLESERRNLENRSSDPVETKPSETAGRVSCFSPSPDYPSRNARSDGGRETGRPSDYPQPDSTEPAR